MASGISHTVGTGKSAFRAAGQAATAIQAVVEGRGGGGRGQQYHRRRTVQSTQLKLHFHYPQKFAIQPSQL